MSTLYIDKSGTKLRLIGQAIEIRTANAPPTRLPLTHVECIVVRGNAEFSSGFLSQCWARQVSVQLLSGRQNRPTARIDGAAHNDARIRVAQAAMYLDHSERCRVAIKMLRCKLLAQRRALREMVSTHAEARKLSLRAIEALTRSASHLRGTQPDLDQIRGIEGSAAAAYFRAFALQFPQSLGFSGRKRRPPPDPVNATLSLAYTLATSEASRALAISGFDPAIGILHDLGHGRPALALDLVEPLRPIADLFVLQLFRKRVLTARHFKTEPDGSVLLGKAGRAHFYSIWEETLPQIRRRAERWSRKAVRAIRAKK